MDSKVGLAPGTLIYVGTESDEKTTFNIFQYTAGNFAEFSTSDIDEALSYQSIDNPVTWINCNGLSDTKVIEKIGNRYLIHQLVLEDILHTEQRPKIEFFDNHIFIVLKMLSWNDTEKSLEYEQVSFILGEGYVISFQERKGDVFDPVRDRIRKSGGKIRLMKSDYLVYSLLDIIVDNYFIALEKIGEKIETLEEELMISDDSYSINDLYRLKREILYIRKYIWPLRELVTKLEHYETFLINDSTGIYLRDLYDHTIQVIDSVEIYRDMVSGLLDLYLSTVSNRMNKVMKVLTVISTVFIPLTFIAGVYGMNFKNMPELEWDWAYFSCLGIMFFIASSMIVYFKKKKWF